MKIAIAGCLHGDFELLYQEIQKSEEEKKYKVDLVLICGDLEVKKTFQSTKKVFFSKISKDLSYGKFVHILGCEK